MLDIIEINKLGNRTFAQSPILSPLNNRSVHYITHNLLRIRVREALSKQKDRGKAISWGNIAPIEMVDSYDKAGSSIVASSFRINSIEIVESVTRWVEWWVGQCSGPMSMSALAFSTSSWDVNIPHHSVH
jgi:hypothetical protein